MFVCCRRENGDEGTESTSATAQSYPATSPRSALPPEDQDGEKALFGERREPLQTGDVRPQAAGLPVVFREGDGGTEIVVTFERAPFGLNVFSEMPLKVMEVSGHAAELGVQLGWEITACGDVPLGSPNLRFADAMEVLHVQADLLESKRAVAATAAGTQCVSVAFRKDGGEMATVNFTEAPLGIDFNPDVPLTVVAASGSAAKLGVQVGWRVKSVGGVDLDDTQLLFSDALEVLKEEVARLGGKPTMTPVVGLPVVFTSGESVTFDQTPLGLDISPALPLKLTGVKGQAAELGVVSGWVVQSVGGARLDDPNLTFAGALALVKSKVALNEARRRRGQLMQAGLPMLFGTPDGCAGRVFHKTPLGMDLSSSVPITVLEAKGQAADLGVQPGWELLAVGGVSVADTTTDFQSALAVLEAMVERLRWQLEARRIASEAFNEA